MYGRVDNGLWALIISVAIVIILYVGAILQTAKSSQGKATKVRVEHIREPLVAMLNFVGIQLALLAATAAFLSTTGSSGTANWFVISAGSIIVAGMLIVWFLLGLPNIAGDSETIEYSFPKHWDVIVFPNVAKILILVGMASYVMYLFVEIKTS